MPANPTCPGDLQQDFRYIARGCRVHAFRSADGALVLKTPASTGDIVAWYAEDGLRLTDLPWLAALHDGRETGDAALCRLIRQAGDDSARLAWNRLRPETGLIALQDAAGFAGPGKAPAGRVNLGPGHAPLNLATDPFILQHHAELFGDRLARLAAAGDLAQARRCLDDLVALTARFWQLGIASETLNFLNNCGYVSDRLIQFDIGEFVASRDLVLAQAETGRLLTRKSFRRLTQTHPDLAACLAARVQERLSPDAVRAAWRQN